jgi:hypothetical protein
MTYNFVGIAILFKKDKGTYAHAQNTNTQHQCTAPHRPNVPSRLHTTSANKSNLLSSPKYIPLDVTANTRFH